MKKYILGLMLAVLVVVPVTGKAVSIAELQAMIARLTEQLRVLQQQQDLTQTWCHNFNVNLGVGSKGDEVIALAKVISKENIPIVFVDSDYVNFGESLASAVVKFQAKYGIIQTGYVGPLTRAKLNSLYKCRINNNPQIIINSVSGPTSLAVGQTGTWKVNATGPAGAYWVDWGDEKTITRKEQDLLPKAPIFIHSFDRVGTYVIRFYVDNGTRCTQAPCYTGLTEASLTVVVGPVNNNLTITYPADSVGQHDFVGYTYSKIFSVANSSNTRNYAWSISSGSLPLGLNLTSLPVMTCPYPCNLGASSRIQITGTPTQAGNFPFTLTVRDNVGNTGSLNLVINIENYGPMTAKPVIYLYPEKVQQTKVQLDYAGKLVADYPTYGPKIGGWEVTAHPDGKLINKADGKEYSYLFWEGNDFMETNYDFSTGFVVRGSDSRAFLQKTLAQMGLTPKEYNEFIVYWYPKMEKNAYNLIHFAGQEYTDKAKLIITPKPESLLRVFMVYRPIDREIEVTPQEIKPFVRKGFTVVEWGGKELSK